MAAVPTSKTPQPHAQASAKPGTEALATVNDRSCAVRLADQSAGGAAGPRAQVDNCMMPSSEIKAPKNRSDARASRPAARVAQRQYSRFRRGTAVRGRFVGGEVRSV